MRVQLRPISALISWIKAAFEKPAPPAPVMQVALRRAVADDFQFIYELSVEQARKGHFNVDHSNPGELAGLALQLSSAIDDVPVRMPPPRNGAGACVWVLTVDLKPVGFAMFLEDRPNSWDRKVELFMVALREDFQGHGLGKLLVTQLLPGVQSKLIYARCHAPSTRMKALLEAHGFKTVNVSKSGMTTLELRPDLRRGIQA
ncbi:MAG: GNAT family N-acetyltransferase [Pelomonas sp.]|nr:GNAT family N-acetyltransferase [Roseateles sp.]